MAGQLITGVFRMALTDLTGRESKLLIPLCRRLSPIFHAFLRI